MSRPDRNPGSRWWRRNWWGMAALLPLVVAVVAISPNDSYQEWQSAEPREAVLPDADGWARYGPTRVRLDALEPARLVDSVTEQEFRPAPGLRAWQATVTFERYPDPDRALARCQFLLEDDLGRLYGDGPQELDGAAPAGGGSYLPSLCLPETEEETAPTFGVLSLFVLPTSAEPVAVWLTDTDQLPLYVRFDVG